MFDDLLSFEKMTYTQKKNVFCISRVLFSHCHHIQYNCLHGNESESEKEVDIEPSSLDEIPEAVASLVVFIKIHPVVLNHGIAHDYSKRQKKHRHYRNSQFFFS